MKHVISCSYKDLVLLQQNLRNITTETYTEESANKTHGYGDRCMMSIYEWGHARLDIVERLDHVGDQNHTDRIGEFAFSVNETCLSCGHNIFMVAPSDTDAHNPLLVRLTPSDMGWEEKQPRRFNARKGGKTFKSGTNARLWCLRPSFGFVMEQLGWQAIILTLVMLACSSSSWQWRPRNRGVYTSEKRR